ncbi:two-component regulator propeller domain-containing protein [Pontibacter chitinilyticus]|uniref:two-component regulator propeller domain-containing protein n=1 Tax=Pontibacter chitinilyticus TaxID=2674989 RepID=UPI003219CF9D
MYTCRLVGLTLQKHYLLLLLLICPFLGQAQQYNFRNWTLEDGLPQSQVNDILQDNQQQLWLATRGGVSRFDGSTFRTFTKQQGLSSNNVSCLLQDSKGRIWAGTSDHGLNLYTNQGFKRYGGSNGLPDTGIHAMAEDKMGRVWVASEQGLYYLVGDRFMQDLSLPAQAYTALLITATNDVWVGSKSDGLYHVGGQPRHYTVRNSALPGNNITSLILHQDIVWVGTTVGLARISDSSLKTYKLPGSVAFANVSSFVEDGYGNLWIGMANSGLLKLQDNSLTHITRANGLRTNHINTLATDVEGNIWIGTDGYGLQQYKSPWFVHYFNFDLLAEPRITALAKDAQERVWFGTDDGYAAFMQGSKPKWLQKPAWPEGTTLYDLWVPGADTTWACTNNGIWLITPKVTKHYTLEDGLPSNTVYQCAADSAGNLWFATANGAVRLSDKTFTTFKAPAVKDPLHINCILRDSKGRMWFGTASGVYRLENGQLQSPQELTSYPMEEVTAIAEDKAGNLYFGAFNYGIVMLTSGEAQLLNEAHGLPNEGVRSLYVDAQDNLWVGTSRSLLKIRLRPLRQSGKLSYRAFTNQDGFRGIEVEYNAITQTADGAMWFGTAKGLTKYIPQLDRRNRVYPQLKLTDILLFLKPPDWEKLGYPPDSVTHLPQNLRLPYSQNHITFDYHGINLSAPSEVKYKYRLAGYEEQWSPATKQSYATYANLDPGSYTFELLAQNNDGYWTPSPLTYAFTIVPPIWRREWFIGVLLLVIAGTILSVVRLREQSLVKMNSLLEMKVQHRTQMLERKNREKETLLQEIHHRVKNNLQIVISMLNLQARHVADPLALDVMRAIRSRVRSMAILHERLYRHDDLGQIDLEDYFKGICESLYASYGVDEQQIVLQMEVPTIKVDIDSAITLGLIVNELVSNTLKYAFPAEQCGLLHICLQCNHNQQYTLTVSDNGKGLPKDFLPTQKQSFGLQLVMALSKKLNGDIHFSNDYGTKSILHFVLPS